MDIHMFMYKIVFIHIFNNVLSNDVLYYHLVFFFLSSILVAEFTHITCGEVGNPGFEP